MNAIQNLQDAFQRGAAIRPKVGGFPYLAETLRQAGVIRNRWSLPSCQSVFLTDRGNVVVPGTPLVTEMAEVPAFDREALIRAIRADQEGKTAFPQFLLATWEAGVVGYDVDFAARTCSYFGVGGEVYVEEYPEVAL